MVRSSSVRSVERRYSLPLRASRHVDVGWILVWVTSRSSLEGLVLTLIDADLEKLADLLISRQGGDVGFACDSASAALAALLGRASRLLCLLSGPFEGAQVALHDAANTCVCGGHIAVMDVSELLDGGGLVEATAATAELLVAEHCRCSDVCGYLQGALEEPTCSCGAATGCTTASGRRAATRRVPGGSFHGGLSASGVSGQQAPAGSRHHQPAGSR